MKLWNLALQSHRFVRIKVTLITSLFNQAHTQVWGGRHCLRAIFFHHPLPWEYWLFFINDIFPRIISQHLTILLSVLCYFLKYNNWAYLLLIVTLTTILIDNFVIFSIIIEKGALFDNYLARLTRSWPRTNRLKCHIEAVWTLWILHLCLDSRLPGKNLRTCPRTIPIILFGHK